LAHHRQPHELLVSAVPLRLAFVLGVHQYFHLSAKSRYRSLGFRRTCSLRRKFTPSPPVISAASVVKFHRPRTLRWQRKQRRCRGTGARWEVTPLFDRRRGWRRRSLAS